MGKKLRQKQMENDLKEQEFFARFSVHASQMNNLPAPCSVVEMIPEVYRQKFYRDPSDYKIRTKSSDRHKQMMEVVRFAFGKFAVPKLLEKAWLSHQNMPARFNQASADNAVKVADPCLRLNGMAKEDFKEWYVCVATGGSLYKERLKDTFTKKEVHTFLTCPFDISLNQAVIYAVAKCAGANEGIALCICRSKLVEKPFNDFWKGIIRFFAMDCPDEINTINDLLDFFTFKKNENHDYAVLGHGFNLESLKKKMKDWHWAMGRIKAMGEGRWDGFDMPDDVFESRDKEVHDKVLKWNFKQIKDAKTLALEGNQMRHCVFSYKHSCVSGKISIWTLTTENWLGLIKKKLTIELRDDGRIAQVRGLANRLATAEEQNIIAKWALKNGLNYNSTSGYW